MIKSIPSFRVKPQLQISKVSQRSNNLVLLRMITSINLGKVNDKQIKNMVDSAWLIEKTYLQKSYKEKKNYYY